MTRVLNSRRDQVIVQVAIFQVVMIMCLELQNASEFIEAILWKKSRGVFKVNFEVILM
jgi:hypothetical protein